MIEYAKIQEKKAAQLTDVEKGRFVHTCQYEYKIVEVNNEEIFNSDYSLCSC